MSLTPFIVFDGKGGDDYLEGDDGNDTVSIAANGKEWRMAA